MKFFVKTKLSENMSKTPEGYLLCRNVMLTHTGKLIYKRGEHPFDEVSEITVTREPEELFSKETLASFEAKSITIEHPQDFVDPKNWKDLTNGVLVNVRKGPEQIDVDGEMVDVLLGDFIITTKEAIEEVDNGLREVSLGYDALWVMTGKDTAVHKNIRGNHCALVDNGRAGVQCAIKDKKGEDEMSKFKELQEKFKKAFGKTVDEALNEKEKENQSKDAEEKAKKIEELKAKKAQLEDELKELESKDEEKPKESEEKKEKKPEESKDEEESSEEQATENERFDKLEKAVSELQEAVLKLTEMLGDDDGEESEEVIADEDDEETEDGCGMKTGDTMARAEILAPGIQETKDVKTKALEAAFKTADGKKAIQSIIGDKKLSEVKDVNALFIAVSEIVKNNRIEKLATTRAVTIDSFPALKKADAMTAEKLNEINKQAYARK